MWQLHAMLEARSSTRGRRIREARRIARARIEDDADVDDPLALARTSQKLITAAMLIRAMPEPSTPEGRNLRREAQALVEQATVQQAESSASCMRHQSTTRTGRGKRDQEESDHTPSRGMAVPA